MRSTAPHFYETRSSSGCIIRNSRDNFISEFEKLPSETCNVNHSLNEKDLFQNNFSKQEKKCQGIVITRV